MGFYSSHWVLTFLIMFPLVGTVAALVVPESRARWVALIVGTIELLVAIPLYWTFDSVSSYQNEVAIPWVRDWGIYYRVGLDGISLFMVPILAVAAIIILRDINKRGNEA